MWPRFFLPLLFLVLPSHSARILGISPVPLNSHQNAFYPIFEELAKNGHSLVVISPIPRHNSNNITEIDVSILYEEMAALQNKMGKLGTWDTIKAYQESGFKFTKTVLEQPEVQELIKGKPFDLVMVEMLFPEFLVFGQLFNCPTILLSSMDTSSIIHWAMGNPSHPVSHPEYVLPFYGTLNFKERIFSTLFQVLININRMFLLDSRKHEILKKYFGESVRSPNDLLPEVDLQFITVNPVLHDVRAYGPTTIPIGGGFHLEPSKPLPESFQNFADDAKEGFIYFSLGSGVKGLSAENMDVILEIFKELPYKVLWKSNSEIPNKPDNVKIVDWVPQQDILKHKNIKLFITQGGMQSLEEGLFSHVPMLVLPVVADQFKNGKSLEEKRAARVIDPKSGLNKKETLQTMLDLINNQKYRENSKKLVQLALDQPMTGMEKVIWWTEYVLRNKGTKHLRNKSVNLPWYQFLLLDVLAFVSVALLVTVVVMKFTLKLLTKFIKNIFGRKEKQL